MVIYVEKPQVFFWKPLNTEINSLNKLGLSCAKLRSSYASQPAHYPNIQTIPIAWDW